MTRHLPHPARPARLVTPLLVAALTTTCATNDPAPLAPAADEPATVDTRTLMQRTVHDRYERLYSELRDATGTDWRAVVDHAGALHAAAEWLRTAPPPPDAFDESWRFAAAILWEHSDGVTAAAARDDLIGARRSFEALSHSCHSCHGECEAGSKPIWDDGAG